MSRWAEKIPGVSHSQRAYTTFLNKLRADSFDAMMQKLTKNGQATPTEAKAIANFINVATGRGSLGMKENALVGLNTIFFAPRYTASRFQLLALQPLYRGSMRTRTMVAGEYARFLTGALIVYGLSEAMGAKVETDSRSSDFGKIQIGDTRIDPLSGLSQATVLLSRVWKGETKSLSGKVTALRGDKIPFGGGMAEVLGRFARTKLSPSFGTAVNVASGRDIVGNKVTPESVVAANFVPISLQDVYETMRTQGVGVGAAIGILSMFGLGVQNYSKTPKQ
jgi:hypothetical protein